MDSRFNRFRQGGKGEFHEENVAIAVNVITEWEPSPEPGWITAIPAESMPGVVEGFAKRLAARLDLPFESVVENDGEKRPQVELANSYQQCWNVQDAYTITGTVRDSPVLLVDDTVGSRWTFTVVGTALRDAGAGPVYPFALADRRR